MSMTSSKNQLSLSRCEYFEKCRQKICIFNWRTISVQNFEGFCTHSTSPSVGGVARESQSKPHPERTTYEGRQASAKKRKNTRHSSARTERDCDPHPHGEITVRPTPHPPPPLDSRASSLTLVQDYYVTLVCAMQN